MQLQINLTSKLRRHKQHRRDAIKNHSNAGRMYDTLDTKPFCKLEKNIYSCMLWGRISLVCFGLERLDMGDSSLYRTHWICRLRCSSKTIRISLELFRPLVAKIRYTPHHHDFWCVLNLSAWITCLITALNACIRRLCRDGPVSQSEYLPSDSDNLLPKYRNTSDLHLGESWNRPGACVQVKQTRVRGF